MKLKRLIIIISLLIMSMPLAAQTGSVSGTVISASDSKPVSGVVVAIKGNTSAWTTTDSDGRYTIKNVPSDAVLTFSILGYHELSVPLGGRAVVDVTIQEAATELEQVVVVGYGSIKKSDLTGSVASIRGEKLKEGIVTNVDQMLQGKLAGVQITQNSGAPGAASSIRIRGASSINNSNEPLYIIDGIPFSGQGNEIGGFDWAGGTNGQKYVNPLSTISPSDIVAIDVLKDASATAIYGANGANGVILVTTKRGKAGTTTISYDGYVTVQQVGKQLNMMNLREYAQYQVELGDFIQQDVDEAYKDPSILGSGTNWQNEIFRSAIMNSHQVSLSGGSDKVQFAASGGYMKQEGVVIGSEFERFNARLNVDGNVFKWLKAGASLAFTNTKETITNNDGTDGVILQALTMQPNIPVYNFDGTWAGPNDVNGASQYNPVWLALMKNNEYDRNRVMGNFYLSADIINGLNIRSEYGYDFSNNNNYAFVPTYSFGVIANNINQLLQRNDQSSYWIWKNYLTYDRSFGGKHRLVSMAGVETSSSEWSGHQIIKQNLSSNDVHIATTDGDFVSNRGWKDKVTSVSLFGRVNYNYDERYLLTATFRADASSKFGSNNKWGYFPSVAAAWRISNEQFMKNMNFISNLKLRLGYGQVGSSNIGTYLYGSGMYTMTTPLGTAYRMKNIANPDLKWEASEQYNAGLDLGLFNEKLSFTLDVYQKDTKDLLLQVSVPSYLGGSTDYNDIATPMVNIGKTRNRGIDISINSVILEKENFSWSSNLTVSVNRNKVLSLNDDAQVLYGKVDWWSEFQNATMIKVGQPIGVFYGYVVDGIFASEDEILNSPVQVENSLVPGTNLINKNTGVYVGDIKFKDVYEDGVIDDKDQTVIGNPNPDFTFGFTNTFTYKNWSLGLVLTGSYGADILNFAKFRTEGMTSIWDNQSSSVSNRAQVGIDGSGKAYLINTDTKMPRPSTNDFNRNNRMSTRFIEDGSYLRIQNLSLSYQVPASIAMKVGMKNLKVYVNGQNLYTLTDYSGYDPEIGAYNQSSLLQNIDRGRYPTPRMVTIGINVGF
ncbi:MAG: TonB-dependent receptor [Rikenellaceae bacterium]